MKSASKPAKCTQRQGAVVVTVTVCPMAGASWQWLIIYLAWSSCPDWAGNSKGTETVSHISGSLTGHGPHTAGSQEISVASMLGPDQIPPLTVYLLIPDPMTESAKRRTQRTKTEDSEPLGQTLPHSPQVVPNKAGSNHLKGVPPSHISMSHLGIGLESVIIQERINLWSEGHPAPQDQRESQEGLISRRYAMQQSMLTARAVH